MELPEVGALPLPELRGRVQGFSDARGDDSGDEAAPDYGFWHWWKSMGFLGGALPCADVHFSLKIDHSEVVHFAFWEQRFYLARNAPGDDF